MAYNVEPHGLPSTSLRLYRSPTSGNGAQSTSNHTIHERDGAFMYDAFGLAESELLSRIDPLDLLCENLSVGRPRSVEAGTPPVFQVVSREEDDTSRHSPPILDMASYSLDWEHDTRPSPRYTSYSLRWEHDTRPSPRYMASNSLGWEEDDTPRRSPPPLAMSSCGTVCREEEDDMSRRSPSPLAMSSSASVSSQNGLSPPTIVQTPQRKIVKAKQSPIRRDSPIETDLVDALRLLQVRPNFQGIVSTTNEWGQTLAHLSILYDYPSLLSSLVDWRIDLTIADANGLTALHYAYMKGDMDSVRILRRGGASETVMDKLGRTPLDLHPEGFGSSTAIDAKAAVEL